MKCSKCGAELKPGSVYCNKCGKEVQIVPDYNLMEDDIASYLNEGNKVHQEEPLNKDELPPKNHKKKKNVLIACAVSGAILVVVIVLMLLSANQKNTSFDYQYNRGIEYLNNGLYDKAYDSFTKALKIDPGNEEASIALAQTYLQQSKEVDAINILLDVIEQNPDSKEAYQLLISIYEDEGDYDSITKLCKTVTNQDILALFDNYIVKDPEFDVKGGTYDDYQTVNLSVSDDAQCFYTTDGSDPKKNGRLFTSEIELPEGTTTIRAIAMNDYNIYSNEVEETYIISLKVPDRPVVSLESGTYTEQEKISITVPEGCIAYYTWDGLTPTAQSTRYDGPFNVIEGNNVLSVILINSNNLSSEVAKFNYIYLPETDDTNQD